MTELNTMVKSSLVTTLNASNTVDTRSRRIRLCPRRSPRPSRSVMQEVSAPSHLSSPSSSYPKTRSERQLIPSPSKSSMTVARCEFMHFEASPETVMKGSSLTDGKSKDCTSIENGHEISGNGRNGNRIHGVNNDTNGFPKMSNSDDEAYAPKFSPLTHLESYSPAATSPSNSLTKCKRRRNKSFDAFKSTTRRRSLRIQAKVLGSMVIDDFINRTDECSTAAFAMGESNDLIIMKDINDTASEETDRGILASACTSHNEAAFGVTTDSENYIHHKNAINTSKKDSSSNVPESKSPRQSTSRRRSLRLQSRLPESTKPQEVSFTKKSKAKRKNSVHHSSESGVQTDLSLTKSMRRSLDVGAFRHAPR